MENKSNHFVIVWRKSKRHNWNIYVGIIEKRLPYFIGMAVSDLIRNGNIEKIQIGIVKIFWDGGNYNERDCRVMAKISFNDFELFNLDYFVSLVK